ncbi:MAG: CoA-disulfide reductase [Oscillospiraceae bacterium]
MKVVVIGGVAAGMSAAAKLKRNLVDNVDISVYEQGTEVSYGACGIPFYVSDKIKDSSDLIAKTPEQFKSIGVNVFIKHEVLKVDTKNKTIEIKNLVENKTFTEKYDKLIVGSGAKVKCFYPFNKNYDNLYKVRNISDGEIIKQKLQDNNLKNVLIIGAGFIGLEMVEACHKYNKNIILVEKSESILSNLDSEITNILNNELTKNNITIKTYSSVSEFTIDGNRVIKATLSTDGKSEMIDTDIIINAVGIAPNSDFIKDVDKIENGAIIVNENMQTNIKDVFAAGDCSVMKSFVTDKYTYAPLGTNANKQGRIIADFLSSKPTKPFKLINSSALKLFSIDCAKVGLSEKEAKSLNIKYSTNTVTGNSYASYYSDHKVTIKLIYCPTTRKILGAQTIGSGNVVPRANYYAIAIYSGLTVDEFGFLDLCYSPPFSGVWDVSLIASNAAK